MRAARLRHRLLVEEPTSTQDENGAEVLGFVPWPKPIWAAIEPIKSREVSGESQLNADLGTTIIIRWSPQHGKIAAKWRFRFVDKHHNTAYNILGPGVETNLGHRELVFTCSSGINEL